MEKQLEQTKIINLRATVSGEMLLPPLRNTPLCFSHVTGQEAKSEC